MVNKIKQIQMQLHVYTSYSVFLDRPSITINVSKELLRIFKEAKQVFKRKACINYMVRELIFDLPRGVFDVNTLIPNEFQGILDNDDACLTVGMNGFKISLFDNKHNDGELDGIVYYSKFDTV